LSIVSIIIPVYNIRDYLDDSVKSVMEQTYKDIEIILVDDGATDGSGQMCDEFAKEDSRIKVIHKVNGGLTSAWSEGVKHATGRYVCFVDGDDWVDCDMIENLLSYTLPEGSDEEIVSSNYIIEKRNEKKKVSHPIEPGVYEGKELENLKYKLLGEENRPVILSRCMKLISRKLVLDNMHYLNFGIRMAEDLNISLPCILDANRLSVVREGYFYHYRTVNSSIAHSYDAGLLDNLKVSYKTFLEILKDKNVSNYKEQVDREYVRLLFLVVKNELRRQGFAGVKTVREVFGQGEVAEIVRNTPVEVSEKSNRLIYSVMKKPGIINTLAVKIILNTYDRLTN